MLGDLGKAEERFSKVVGANAAKALTARIAKTEETNWSNGDQIVSQVKSVAEKNATDFNKALTKGEKLRECVKLVSTRPYTTGGSRFVVLVKSVVENKNFATIFTKVAQNIKLTDIELAFLGNARDSLMNYLNPTNRKKDTSATMRGFRGAQRFKVVITGFIVCMIDMSIERDKQLTSRDSAATKVASNPMKSDIKNCFNDDKIAKQIASVTVPDGQPIIPPRRFELNDNLRTVDLANRVSVIGDSAFEGCDALTTVKNTGGLKKIGSSAFSMCTQLTDFDIPDSVETIEEKAFCGCRSLTSINIPSKVRVLNKATFLACRGLSTVEIPEGVRSIGATAFFNCVNLTEVSIPSSVTTVGDDAFSGCPNLKVAGSPKENIRETIEAQINKKH